MEYKQIVVYDVLKKHRKLRTKIVQKLLDYGLERIQYSVFGGSLTQEETENLVTVLKRLKTEKKADIRIFLLRKSAQTASGIITISEAIPPHPGAKETRLETEKKVMVF